MGEFQVTEQNQNIKEVLTGALSILGKTGQLYRSLNRKWSFTVFFIGEMLWQFCQQVLATESMIFTVFAVAKEEMSSLKTCMCTITIYASKKYYRQTDFGNVDAELYSDGVYNRNR